MDEEELEVYLADLKSQVEKLKMLIEEAFEKRRELVKLLVEKIALSHNEDGRTKVDITCRFGLAILQYP